MNEEIINQIASILGQSGDAIVDHYTLWFIANSILWVVVGIVGIWLSSKFQPKEDWDFHPFATVLIRTLMVGVCVLLIGFNAPDLLTPRAAAIHQLLIDLPG